jgi:putative beta barrel porin BBP7
MRFSIQCGVVLLLSLITWTSLSAQQPATVSVPSCEGPPICMESVCGCAGGWWVRGEALWWWTRGQKLPPLITTSPEGTALEDAGVLGVQGTTILFGDERVDGRGRIGSRVSGGYWCDQACCGIEANFFWLSDASTTFDANSDQVPILARPFLEITPEQLTPQPNALLIAYPGFVSGSAHITTSTECWGGEILVRKNVCDDCCWRVDLLGGYRYLRLKERLHIDEVEINIGDETFPVGTRFDLTDRFDTLNQFHGGEIGLAVELRRCCWTLEVTGKVAVGVTSRRVDIDGSTVISFPGEDTVTHTGGFLALPSNIGRHEGSQFAVVPEVDIRLSYAVCENLRAFVGYTFIYWSDVARPGDQIDLVINSSQVPPGTLEGPARPEFRFKDSAFWLQGISLGLELRY